MKNKFKSWSRLESGQSIVEFAVIIPILILLVTLPIDYFRYINTKMILNSAASECISQLNYASINGSAATEIMTILNDAYVDRLDVGRVNIETLNFIGSTKKDYTYYVYTSAKADSDPAHFWNQFDERPSSYQCEVVELQFSYQIQPITIWGKNFFKTDNIQIITPKYTRAVYAGGYATTP